MKLRWMKLRWIVNTMIGDAETKGGCMDEHVMDVNRPWQVWALWGVMGVDEGFHSGYMDKAQAEAALVDVNKRAIEMGIKTRYFLKDMTPKVEVPTMSIATAQAMASATGQPGANV